MIAKKGIGVGRHQSLVDEVPTADGLTSATVFFHLATALASIWFGQVLVARRSFGFPPAILRLTLEAFVFAR